MSAAADRLGAPASLVMMGWLSGVLWLDRATGDGGLWLQRGLGVLTWGVLGFALLRVSPLVRAQVAVVVCFATAVEYLFSPTLHVYSYRLDNVPMYVPPGHGLVYLSAFALGHAVLGHVVLGHGAAERRRMRWCGAVVLLVGGSWATYGVLLAERQDVLGAFWFACLALFLARGPSQPVYVGAFVVVSWLELLGTHLGTWTWATQDFTGRVSIGNPPSGAAGGYGWFDLAALLLAPRLLAWVSRRPAQEPAEEPVVER